MSFIAAVLRAIGKNPGAPIEELADTLKSTPTKVRNHIGQAVSNKWAERKLDESTRRPGYHLTANGRAKLAQYGEGKAPAAPRDSDSEGGEADVRAESPEKLRARVAEMADILLKIGAAAGCTVDTTPRELPQAVQSLANAIHSHQREASKYANALGQQNAAIEMLRDDILGLLPDDHEIVTQVDVPSAAIVQAVATYITALRTRTEATVTAGPDPRGYMLYVAKRKPRRITRYESARAAALAAVRNGAGRADLFALHPAGHARRGADWSDLDTCPTNGGVA